MTFARPRVVPHRARNILLADALALPPDSLNHDLKPDFPCARPEFLNPESRSFDGADVFALLCFGEPPQLVEFRQRFDRRERVWIERKQNLHNL